MDGTYFSFLEKTAKTDVLILDDFGLMPLQGQELVDMMEIIKDRHGLKSTIIASQIPFAKWYEVMTEATIADAILDRVIHTAYKIELKGENLRINGNFVRLLSFFETLPSRGVNITGISK